ncbi:MAG: NAD(P)-binding protein, partial [Chloroflexi bacterium]|nr:NAD(P)-binding protein [Chloroflexota bacterium]
MARSVAILGGGVAGMSAAHELVERGFDVEVFELHPIPGGKARSLAVPLRTSFANVGSVHLPRGAKPPRKHLPGEHGFRFFPRFYKHVVDTMARIPYGRFGSVADNLVDTANV